MTAEGPKEIPLSRQKKARNESHLKCRYGLTPEHREAMATLQNDCCGICGKHESKLFRKLYVDHCHSTGKIRGLLCIKCNKDLAVIEDTEYVSKATQYLKKYSEIHSLPNEIYKKPKQVPEAKAEDLIKPLSVLDTMTEEEVLYWATPYFDELQIKKQLHAEHLKAEGDLNGN